MLGDAIGRALDTIGVTPDAVERWLGRPCQCAERKKKLNALDAWARRVLAGKVEQAKEYLDALRSSR